MLRLVPLVIALWVAPLAAAAEATIELNPQGVVVALHDGPRSLPATFNANLFGPGWATTQSQWQLENVSTARDNDATVVSGTWPVNGVAVGFRLTTTPEDGATTLTYRIEGGERDVDMAGVFLVANVPVNRFAGGVGVAQSDGMSEGSELPQEFGEKDLTTPRLTQALLFDAPNRSQVALAFDQPMPAHIQDARAFDSPEFGGFIALHEGPLKAGQVVERTVRVRATLPADDAPANVTVDFGAKGAAFDGFGGNFVYGIDSPQTDATLRTLPMAWARGEIVLTEWEPKNDDADPFSNDVAALATRDVAGSILRKRFELDKRLFEQSKGRYILSNWRLPEWMYAEPVEGWRDVAGVVPAERWDEVDESVVTYLLHLKTRYGVEPVAFSFNESDYGVHTKLTADEYRDHVLRLGRRMEKAGLKTKLLLGDSASLGLGLEQMLPTADDTEAMKYVVAIANHPWAGEHEHWPAWAAFAEEHNVPLLLTEVGADAAAWANDSMHTLPYAVKDLRRYAELLRDARSQSLMTWEWTADYALLIEDGGNLVPTPRYWFVWQLANTTPMNSTAVATTSDRADVIAAAFARGNVHTVHLANLNDGREATVTLTGLPASIKELRVVTLALGDGKPVVSTIPLQAGAAKLVLPPRSLVTLTTGDVPALPTFE